jgi:DNA-binding MarR family transcriptional regulator
MTRPRSNGEKSASPAGTDATRPAEEALRRIVRGLRVASRQVEDTAPISAAQLFVLQQLAETPGMSVRELADRTMTDRTSVAHVLELLEGEGYVARRRSSQDRRRYEILIERKGKALLARAPLSPTVQVLEAMACLSPSELAGLTRGLQRLVGAMGLAGGTLPPLFADTPEGARAPSGKIRFAARRPRTG